MDSKLTVFVNAFFLGSVFMYRQRPSDGPIYHAQCFTAYLSFVQYQLGGARWRSCLRHCATNRNVAGSIPDGVTGIFHWHNRFGLHYGPGVDSASNRNEYQEYFLGGKGGRCLTTFMCRLSTNMGASTSWTPQGLSRPVMGLLYLFTVSTYTRVTHRLGCKCTQNQWRTGSKNIGCQETKGAHPQL
jgi:hypothetical protein